MNVVLMLVVSALQTSQSVDYFLIASQQLVGVFLTVWAHKRVLPHIRGIQVPLSHHFTLIFFGILAVVSRCLLSLWHRVVFCQVTSVSTGFGGFLGNKGSVAVRMRVYDTGICWMCVHLASGEGQPACERRIQDVTEICRRLEFPAVSRNLNTQVGHTPGCHTIFSVLQLLLIHCPVTNLHAAIILCREADVLLSDTGATAIGAAPTSRLPAMSVWFSWVT
jgi:hypothetical protein